MDDHYDLVVVGHSPAALATAALLAKRRRRVLLALPPAPETDPAGDGSGWTANVAEAPHVRRVLQALNLSHALRGNHARHPVRMQLVGAQARVEVAAEPKEALSALQAAYPSHASGLVALHERLAAQVGELDNFLANQLVFPEETRWARWRQQPLPGKLRPYGEAFGQAAEDALFGTIPPEHELRRLLLWPSLPTGPLPLGPKAAPPSRLAVVRGLWHTFFAPAAAAGTLASWRAHLLQSAERHGAHVVRGVGATKLLLTGSRRAHGVHLQLQGASQNLGAKWLVADARAEGWLDEPVQAATTWPTFAVEVPRGLLPAALGPRTWVLDRPKLGLARPWHANGLAGEDAPVRLVRRPGEETDTLEATWFARESGAGAPLDGGALLERLQALLPFVPQARATWRQGEAQGTAGDATVRRGAASRTLKFANVLHCGDDVVAEMGLEGAFVRAAGIAQLLAQRASWG